MPTTITHRSWCREHQTDYEGEHCFVGFGWGPLRPATDQFEACLHGDVWASQSIGTAEPTVNVEYGAQSIELHVEDLLSLRRAVDGLLKAFGLEVIA